MSTISIREYARRRGCADTTVHKAIRAGKIVAGVVFDEAGKPSINEAVADQEWSKHFDSTRAVNKTLAKKLTPEPKPLKGKQTQEEPESEEEEQTKTNQTGGTLAQARLMQTAYKAQITKLEFQEKLGKLVDKEKVYSQLFSWGKEIRLAFQAIPDRHIDEILSAPSRNAAHELLLNAITETLEMLSDIEKREIVPRS
jgi:hypothetical protein